MKLISWDGTKPSTCINHISTNSPELCNKVLSVPNGCSDHNLIINVLNSKMTGPGPTVILKRLYKMFDHDKFVDDVKEMRWSEVFS